ncbi:hypothetical protein COV19_05255 [Candidatus Woesearchaeota archaeon CG10_big_fil_rev_8_21_14_0_10_44_13]|nr:MAG: hypothetical protein COV19_05255 [Candidatus Woesearchaeota archaeon CG10_big_fil_rev_8_21_14_0_10_44_13]
MRGYAVTVHIRKNEVDMRDSYRKMSDSLRDMDGRSDGLSLDLNYFSQGQLMNVKASCKSLQDRNKVDKLVEYMLGYIPTQAVENVERRAEKERQQ